MNKYTPENVFLWSVQVDGTNGSKHMTGMFGQFRLMEFKWAQAVCGTRTFVSFGGALLHPWKCVGLSTTTDQKLSLGNIFGYQTFVCLFILNEGNCPVFFNWDNDRLSIYFLLVCGLSTVVHSWLCYGLITDEWLKLTAWAMHTDGLQVCDRGCLLCQEATHNTNTHWFVMQNKTI